MDQIELRDVHVENLHHAVNTHIDPYTVFLETEAGVKVFVEFRNGNLSLSYEKDGIERFVDVEQGSIGLSESRLMRREDK